MFRKFILEAGPPGVGHAVSTVTSGPNVTGGVEEGAHDMTSFKEFVSMMTSGSDVTG